MVLNLSTFAVFLNNRNIISIIRRSKVTDYAALGQINSIIEITNPNVERKISRVGIFPGKSHWHGKYAYLPPFCQP